MRGQCHWPSDPPCRSAVLKANPDDEKPKPIIRPYTPTSPPDAKGYLDLVVKVYEKVRWYGPGASLGVPFSMAGDIDSEEARVHAPGFDHPSGSIMQRNGLIPLITRLMYTC